MDEQLTAAIAAADVALRELATLSDDGLRVVYVPPTDGYRQRYRVTLYMFDGNKQGEGETLQSAVSKALEES